MDSDTRETMKSRRTFSQKEARKILDTYPRPHLAGFGSQSLEKFFHKKAERARKICGGSVKGGGGDGFTKNVFMNKVSDKINKTGFNLFIIFDDFRT